MPACRFCQATYPREYFIHGNGPRKDVCQRCGISQGMITEDEATMVFDSRLANSRLNLLSRRWALLLWVLVFWGLWFSFMSSIPAWGIFTLVALSLITLLIPVILFLGRAKYSALMARLTPEHQRPPGH